MSGFNRIPFALYRPSGEYVDASEVARGRACDCYCPSCGLPLEARQGEVNVPHFAHATRGLTDKPDKPCEFSFFVSAKIMAKQIMSEQGFAITLPEFICQSHRTADNKVIVTGEHTITFDSVSSERKPHETKGDVVGTIQGYALHFFFIHPEQQGPLFELIRQDGKTGLLEINFGLLESQLISLKAKGSTYKNALRTFLSQDLVSKCWIDHPNLKSAQQQVNHRDKEIEAIEIARIKSEQRALKSRYSRSRQTKRPSNYGALYCPTCDHRWIAKTISDRFCKLCGSQGELP